MVSLEEHADAAHDAVRQRGAEMVMQSLLQSLEHEQWRHGRIFQTSSHFNNTLCAMTAELTFEKSIEERADAEATAACAEAAAEVCAEDGRRAVHSCVESLLTRLESAEDDAIVAEARAILDEAPGFFCGKLIVALEARELVMRKGRTYARQWQVIDKDRQTDRHTHTDSQTDRLINILTHTHTHTQTHTHTHTHTHTSCAK